MNYNFTDDVRKVLARAREEAIGLLHDYVGTEHILLALLREQDGLVPLVLASLGARPQTIRELQFASVRPGRSTIAVGELPYTSRAKKVLEYSMGAARDAKDSFVGTEHLLVGLLREEKGIAAQVLNECGVHLGDTLRVIAELRAQDPDAAAAKTGWLAKLAGAVRGRPEEEPEPAVFRIEVDDASELSIYEQIVARVQEAVATGDLKAGQRLPPVRRLADQLDIATGTVARAYGELERLGVVVTEGARGTRVADRAPSPRRSAGPDTLAGLLRPVAVAAFHMGATAQDLRAALESAMTGIFDEEPEAG